MQQLTINGKYQRRYRDISKIAHEYMPRHERKTEDELSLNTIFQDCKALKRLVLDNVELFSFESKKEKIERHQQLSTSIGIVQVCYRPSLLDRILGTLTFFETSLCVQFKKYATGN